MKSLVTAIFFMLSFVACGQNADDLATLRKLNATFIHNFVTNDTASHNRIIHKDFVCITGEGQSIDRKTYLTNWAHGFDGFIYWHYRNEDIKIFGNTALVHSQNKYLVVREGKEISG